MATRLRPDDPGDPSTLFRVTKTCQIHGGLYETWSHRPDGPPTGVCPACAPPMPTHVPVIIEDPLPDLRRPTRTGDFEGDQ